MNNYINVTNIIKINMSKEWLTQSQINSFNKIISYCKPPHKIINLYGKKGAGKTFLSWILEKEKIGKYINSPEELIEATQIEGTVIIDNCNSDHIFIRNIRNRIHEKDICRAIVVTRYKTDDKIPTINLDITQDDIKVFRANLFRNNIKVKDHHYSNYWDILNNIEA